jgi:predicted solute-binding protein
LKEKYGSNTSLERIKSKEYADFSAVLLIGDTALKKLKEGIKDFKFCYDLAAEWYSWQKLPFVFAVFAVNKSLSDEIKNQIQDSIKQSLEKGLNNLEIISSQHGKMLGYTPKETKEYLEGFNFHLGDGELEAIRVFKGMVNSMVKMKSTGGK